jgi:hypothetical protein
MSNIDDKIINRFSEELVHFDQIRLPNNEVKMHFKQYFAMFLSAK